MNGYISIEDINRTIIKYRDDEAAINDRTHLQRAYGANKVGMLLSELSPADVRENTHGEWIKISPNLYRCSECGRVVEKDWMEDIQIDYPFCHCGAIMDGGKTE